MARPKNPKFSAKFQFMDTVRAKKAKSICMILNAIWCSDFGGYWVYEVRRICNPDNSPLHHTTVKTTKYKEESLVPVHYDGETDAWAVVAEE